MFESDVPIVVQHTRLDSREAEIALLSTMALPGLIGITQAGGSTEGRFPGHERGACESEIPSA